MSKYLVTITSTWELDTDAYDDDDLTRGKAAELVENDIRCGDLYPSEGKAGWVQLGAFTRAEPQEDVKP